MAPTRTQNITQTDKLRAMNNLQSEITRRARSLRAEYARVAQSLRSKLEMRIYRIPKALRNAKMGDLLQKYIEMQNEDRTAVRELTGTVKVTDTTGPKQTTRTAVKASHTKTAATKSKGIGISQTKEMRTDRLGQSSRAARGVKRASDIMIAADNGTDKENEEALENPKKRTKEHAKPTARSLRDPSAVLSPKSSNSRNIPQSPTRPMFGVSSKGYSSRPASPLKAPAPTRLPPSSPMRQPARPATVASTAGTTRTATSRATKATTASTRAAPSRVAPKSARSASNSTSDSATTSATVVRRGAISRAGGTTAPASARKTTATASTAASARRTAATRGKAEARPETASAMSTRRVLRKRT